jgi:hypothetical protein
MKVAGTHFCPCCGFYGLHSPAYEQLGDPPFLNPGPPPYSQWLGPASYDVCPCCGFEFGFDDEPGATSKPSTFEAYFHEWFNEGCKWFIPDIKPEGWSLEVQLANAHLVRNRA